MSTESTARTVPECPSAPATWARGHAKLVVLLVALLAISVLAIPAHADEDAPADISTQMHQYLRQLSDQGFWGSVLVVQDGETIVRDGFGVADRSRNLPNSPETVFYLGALSKQFTAAAILKLQQEGKLDVKDPITRFFRNVDRQKEGITVEMLLTHSSGLVEQPVARFEKVKRDEVARRVIKTPLRFFPGTQYGYSSGGYALLGVIIELVSGKKFTEYLREEIFLPAGMERTGFIGEEKWELGNVARAYNGMRDLGSVMEWNGPHWGHLASGGVVSSIADLEKWHAALAEHEILNEETTRLLFGRYVKTPSGYYGYGWRVKTVDGKELHYHFGNESGYSSAWMETPEDGTLVIVLSNRVMDTKWPSTRFVEYAAETARALLDRLADHDFDIKPEFATK